MEGLEGRLNGLDAEEARDCFGLRERLFGLPKDGTNPAPHRARRLRPSRMEAPAIQGARVQTGFTHEQAVVDGRYVCVIKRFRSIVWQAEHGIHCASHRCGAAAWGGLVHPAVKGVVRYGD